MVDRTHVAANAERYRQFLEVAPDAMLVVDDAGTIVVVNVLAERLFGYPREALLGKPVEVLVPERLRGRHVGLRQAYTAAPQTRAMASGLELSARRRDGSEFPAEISLGPLQTPEGLLIVAAVRDVTEQRRVQRETANNLRIQNAVASILRKSLEPLPLEEFLPQTIDTLLSVPGLSLQAKAAIFLMDEQTGTLTLAAQRGLPDSLLSQCASLPMGRCLCGRAAASKQAVFTDGVDDRHEISYPEMVNHGHYCVPILTDDTLYGVITLYVEPGHKRTREEERFLTAVADTLAGTIRHHRTEQALRANEERFQLAIRGTDAGIFDWDLRTNEVRFSARWKSMLGFAEDELADSFDTWETRLHPEDRSRALAALRAYLAGETKDYELEHRLRHKDESYRWILSRGGAVFDDSGKPYRMVGSHLDITERRRAEAELQQRTAELLAAGMIQRHLLPSEPPVLPGFEIAGAMFPARFAAGDHYDYLRLPDGRWAFVVADVSGKGVGPAVLVAAVHARLAALAESTSDVSDILARTNARLSAESDPGMFVTLFLGCLDPRARTLVYASAGHPPGFVIGRDGQLRCTLDSTSLPLAIDPGARFPAAGPIVLQPGDTMLVLTDGVLEAADPAEDFFGSERALETLRAHRHEPAAEIVDALYRAVSAFTHPDRPQDDVTAVVIKVL